MTIPPKNRDPFEMEFKKITGFPDHMVSHDGAVWTRRPRNGKGEVSNEWRELKPKLHNKTGHMRVILYKGDAVKHYRYVHRLVLEAFIGPCPEGMEACHNDGDAGNNDVANLRWDSHKSNGQDSSKHGRTKRGEDCHLSKLKAKEVMEIKRQLKDGRSQRAIASEFGVTQAAITDIARRRNWRDVEPAMGSPETRPPVH